MLFLEAENKILKDILDKRIGESAPRPVEPTEIRVCDFDDVQYDLSIADSVLSLSIAYPPFKELAKFGAQGMLSVVYSEFQVVAPKTGYDLTLQVNVDIITPANAGELLDTAGFFHPKLPTKLTARRSPDFSASFISRLALLKRNLIAAPFELCFQALSNDTAKSFDKVQFPFRRNEMVYVAPQADRVVIVYTVCFGDKTDQAIARVFLQEFVETRRTVNNAPPMAFSKTPPREMTGFPEPRPSSDLVGYLSLTIFPSHVDTNEKRTKAATLVTGLRNYLLYHIKASKTHLHIRMRKRVDLLLQVLNRASPEKDPAKSNKKTISGRTFSRQ